MTLRKLAWYVPALAGLLLFGALLPAFGQAMAPEPAPEAVQQTMSWREVMQSGGWPMWVLLGMSALTVALVLYFAYVLRVAQIAPRGLMRVLVETIRAGSVDDARRACEYRPCPLSEVALAAMDHVRDVPGADTSLLRDVLDGEGGRQAEKIEGQTQYLLDVAVIAPMVGLLGTVFGMLTAFRSVALDIAQAKPVVLAEGVSQALITTAYGLIVGIPAMMFYAFFRRRAALMVSALESSSTAVLTALLSKRTS